MPVWIKARASRALFNLAPVYRGTGGKVVHISDDFREIRVELPLNWRTRNYVGTIYGGSIYAAVDPMYMMILLQTLGPEYVVWDKAAGIRFKKPGRSTLYARFLIREEELAGIRDELTRERSTERVYRVDLVDAAGMVHAEVEKVIYIRRKRG